MNIKRGFFRLWVLLSGAWICLAAIITLGEKAFNSNFENFFMLSITFPLSSYISTFGIIWLLQGFRKNYDVEKEHQAQSTQNKSEINNYRSL